MFSKIALIFVFCLLTAKCHEVSRIRRDTNSKIVQANKIVSHLSDMNKCLSESKVSQFAGKLLTSTGFVGNLIGFIFSFTSQEKASDPRIDQILNKIDVLTEEMRKGFENIKNEIGRAVQEIKSFVEKSNFRRDILLKVDNMADDVAQYIKYPSNANKNSLKTLCTQNSPKSLLMNMKTMIYDGSVREQLKAQGYSDTSFNHLQSLYNLMMKQIIISHPICEVLLHGESTSQEDRENRNRNIVAIVESIEKGFRDENENRINNFWSRDVFEPLLKRHMDSSNDMSNVRYSLFGEIQEKYSQIGYYFAIGVFQGYHEHQFAGDVILASHHNGMKTYIARNKQSASYQKCSIEHKTNYMPQLKEYIFEMCPNTPALAIVGYGSHYINYHPIAFDYYPLGKNSVVVAKVPN